MKPIDFARRLRRDMTDAERKLWSRLRDRRLRGLKFRRQVPIGRHIVDFACIDAKLVIEVDGGQHTAKRDALRTRAVEDAGYLVLRFWNDDVLARTDTVLAEIDRTVAALPGGLTETDAPHPSRVSR